MRDFAVCGALDPLELARLDAVTSRWVAKPGEALFRDGDPASHFFVITEGLVRTFKLLPDGRRLITGFLFPGDFLGFSCGGVYRCDAEAIALTGVCRFPRPEFEELLKELPHLENRLLQFTSNELVAAQERMLLLGRKRTGERLAHLLVWAGRRAAAHGRNGNLIRLSLTRTDIADYLGLTVETVSREFGRLRKAGLIALPTPREVEILDVGALAEMAELDLEEPDNEGRPAYAC